MVLATRALFAKITQIEIQACAALKLGAVVMVVVIHGHDRGA